jgi:hypothetical protein
MLGRCDQQIRGASQVGVGRGHEPDRTAGDGAQHRQDSIRAKLALEDEVELGEGQGA